MLRRLRFFDGRSFAFEWTIDAVDADDWFFDAVDATVDDFDFFGSGVDADDWFADAMDSTIDATAFVDADDFFFDDVGVFNGFDMTTASSLFRTAKVGGDGENDEKVEGGEGGEEDDNKDDVAS